MKISKVNAVRHTIIFRIILFVFIVPLMFVPSLDRKVYGQHLNQQLQQSSFTSFFGIEAAHTSRSRAGHEPTSVCTGISVTYDCKSAPAPDTCEDLNFRCVCPQQFQPGGKCHQRFVTRYQNHTAKLDKTSRIVPTCKSEACAKEQTAVEFNAPHPIDHGDQSAVHAEIVSNRRRTRASGNQTPWAKSMSMVAQKRRGLHEKRARSRAGSPAPGPDGWVWPSENLPEVGGLSSCEEYVTHKYDSYVQWEEKVKELGRDSRKIYEQAHSEQWQGKVRGAVQSLEGDTMHPAGRFGATSAFTPIDFNQVNEGEPEYKNVFIALVPKSMPANKRGHHPAYIGFDYPDIDPSWVDTENKPLQPVHYDIATLKARNWAQTPKTVYSWDKHMELNNTLKEKFTDEELETRYRKQMQIQEQVRLRNDLLNGYFRSTLYCFTGFGWRLSPDDTAKEAREAENAANEIEAKFNAEKQKLFRKHKKRLLKPRSINSPSGVGFASASQIDSDMHSLVAREANATNTVNILQYDLSHKRGEWCTNTACWVSRSCCTRDAKVREIESKLAPALEEQREAREKLQKARAANSFDELRTAFPEGQGPFGLIISPLYKNLDREVPKLQQKRQEKIRVAEAKYNAQEEDKKKFCKDLGYPALMKRPNHISVHKQPWRLASLMPAFLTKEYIAPAGRPVWMAAENAPPISDADVRFANNLHIMAKVRQLTVHKLRAFDQQIVELFKHGVELGCFTTELSACDWSPTRFAEWVKNYRKKLIAAREQDFKRCQKLTIIEKPEAGTSGKEKWTFRPLHRDVVYKGDRKWPQVAASPATLEAYFTEVEDFEAALKKEAQEAAKYLRAVNPETHIRTLGNEPRRDAYTGNDRYGAGYSMGGGWKAWNYDSNPCLTKISIGADFNVYAKLFNSRVDFIDAVGKVTVELNKVHTEVRLDVIKVDLASPSALMQAIAELPSKVREIAFAEAKQQGIELLKQDVAEYGTDAKKALGNAIASFAKNVLKETIRQLWLKSIVNPPIDERIPLNFHMMKDPLASQQLLQITGQFFIGPVPVFLKAGASAGFGLRFDYDSTVKREANPDKCAQLQNPMELKASVTPYLGAEAFAAVGVGIVDIAEIGIKGTVKLIGLKLPLTGTIGLSKIVSNPINIGHNWGILSNKIANMINHSLIGRRPTIGPSNVDNGPLPGHYFTTHIGLNFELDALSGNFSVYLKLLSLINFEWTLFSWAGWFTSINLAEASWKVNLNACKQAVDIF